jgi:hypothetical protein
MELKVACDCGQHYKFDVEPVGGLMPFTVNCPTCNADGTPHANALITEQLGASAMPPPPIAPSVAPSTGGLRINRTEPAAPAPSTTTPPPLDSTGTPDVLPTIGAVAPLSTAKKPRTEEFSLVRGIIGAVAGSLVGCGLMFGFWMEVHFRFPIMGVAVGACAGYAARWLARGTDTTLGVITAVIAGASVTGTFVLMYGDFAAFNFISIIICCGVAYRASS